MEKLLVMSNFSFSHSVFYPFGKLSAMFIKFIIVVCKLFQFGRVLNSAFGKGFNKLVIYSHIVNSIFTIVHNAFNPFPNKPWFLRVYSKSLLKTLWEKEKWLLMSHFSFSHSVFNGLENFLPFSSTSKSSSAISFSLEESKICCLGKG